MQPAARLHLGGHQSDRGRCTETCTLDKPLDAKEARRSLAEHGHGHATMGMRQRPA
ncbi:hypothetical protein ACWCQ1_39600 [Streptomyces sp. NPDC002144]